MRTLGHGVGIVNNVREKEERLELRPFVGRSSIRDLSECFSMTRSSVARKKKMGTSTFSQ